MFDSEIFYFFYRITIFSPQVEKKERVIFWNRNNKRKRKNEKKNMENFLVELIEKYRDMEIFGADRNFKKIGVNFSFLLNIKSENRSRINVFINCPFR